ncbi:helix-turn-helix domain-containing protein [Paracoccus suum]|uniref:Helix-turn-helix domain-containing protein n=1 Tax=Paracoccus suum TaxID=2259340 RepID=A0A344PPH5_9RHOB|nr:helix-turn-helix domain-containing protein [Paracoccus suum]
MSLQSGEAGARAIEPGEDARLYLRHVEGGETIRALAREAGCHASTILRRIRRIEARRDDPLVDGALSRKGAGAAPSPDAAARTAEADELRRVLRRLAESGAQMAVASGMEKAIITRDDIRTAILGRPLAERLALNGWVVQIGEGRLVLYQISSLGREALRQMLTGQRPVPMPRPSDLASARPVARPADLGDPHGMAESQSPFDHVASHPRLGDAYITDPEDGRTRRVRVNLSESPLLVLARRRDRDGRSFLTPEMVAAGERLREDFELAQMGPRVAQNWDRFLTSGIDVSRNAAAGFGGGSDNARGRVAAALRDLGPGMGDMVLRVCCFLEGVEATEQRLGWSARSGKIVLRLALMRLDRYYRDTYGPGSPMIG